ncbi:ABC transporter permease [Frondihabitans sucicola]|uniref:ABC transporter permease n=1 Tax=Frondihabitans sucicola TaxID=1268041 RepID=UPI0025739298|nr:ABC transporter permease [Frondihabitans sucicola]
MQPTALHVDAPVDPTTLRSEIEGDVRTTLLAFTGIAVIAAVVALGNSMVLAILERRAEFGLRRAVGARSVHVASMVVAESAIIGALGGLAGLVLGFAAVSAMTLLQHWSPIFDPVLAPLAVVGGILVGSLGGLVAAWQATRIQPQAALRS